MEAIMEAMMQVLSPVEDKVIATSQRTMPDTSMGRFREMEVNDARKSRIPTYDRDVVIASQQGTMPQTSRMEAMMEDETPVEEKVIATSQRTMPDTSMGRFREMEANDARMASSTGEMSAAEFIAQYAGQGLSTMAILGHADAAGFSRDAILRKMTKPQYRPDASPPVSDTSVGRFREMEANDARMMAPETMLHDTSVGRFRKIERDSMEANEAEAMQNEVPEGQSRMLPRGIHRDLDLFYGRERFRPAAPMMAGAAPMMGNRAAPMMGMPSMGMNEVEGFDRRFALPEVSSALGDTFTQRPMMQPLREPSGMLSIDGQPSRPRFIPRSRNVGER